MVGNLSELKGLLIKANTRAGFEAKLAEGLILSTSVVFILDTHEIWTQGEYFPCPYSKEEIDTVIESINNNISQLNDFYSGLLQQLQKYQNDTNALIAQKEQSATQALSLEIARASGEEAKLQTAVTNVTNSLSQELERAVAAENELRNSKYEKPTDGIPKTDLAIDVQTSLDKADTALQEHQSLTDYAKVVDLTSHASNISNPHSVTKAQVGLGNVDNTSDADKPISTATQTALNNKVDKVSGKGLSTNDYTTTEKNKLAGIADNATKVIIDSALSSTSTNPVQNKIIKAALDEINIKLSWKLID